MAYIDTVKAQVATAQNSIAPLLAEMHVDLGGGYFLDTQVNSDQITLSGGGQFMSFTYPGGVPEALKNALTIWLA